MPPFMNDEDSRLLLKKPTSSRLVPVSRSHVFSIPVPPRDRVMPALPAQSAGQPGLSSGTSSDNEMLTVMSRYTDCVGSQNLPEGTRDLYQLIARMASFASGSDVYPFTRTDASDAVRCIDRYVMETGSESRTTNLALSTMAGDAELYRLYAVVGDLAQKLCEDLKDSISAPLLKQQWTIILPKLDEEEGARTAWEASSEAPRPERPKTPFMDVLALAVRTLNVNGMTDVDLDLALFAIRTYARRNSLFHGKSIDLLKSKRFAELARYLDLEESHLEGLLPDKEKASADKYRRLIKHFRSSSICLEGDRNWGQRQAPQLALPQGGPEEVPSSFRPLGEFALRASMEMGDHRPSGLTGPPAPSVSFSPASLRRHTLAELRGTKRPAEEQPLALPRAKAARGLDFGAKKVQAEVPPFSDNDHLHLGRLQSRLHQLTDEITRVSPGKARKLFDEQVPQCEQVLKRAKGSLEKQARDQERKKRRSKYVHQETQSLTITHADDGPSR